jgi:hypothetical protein
MSGLPATRRPDGPYLIESSPTYPLRRVVVLQQRLLSLPSAIVSAAVSKYLDELNHMLDAPAIYLGPGK